MTESQELNAKKANPPSAFHELKSYNPSWGKGTGEIDFCVGKDLSKRNRRLICRTAKASRIRPARLLLTVLLDVMRKFRAYKKSIAVRKASDLYKHLGFYDHQDAKGASSTNGKSPISDMESNGFYVKDVLTAEELRKHEKDINDVLTGLVRKEVGSMERFVTRKILYDWERIDVLIEQPDVLKREIARCVQYSNFKKKRNSRRRRGSRINRKSRTMFGTKQ